MCYHLKIDLIRVNREHSWVRKCKAKVGSQLWQLASIAGKKPDRNGETISGCQLMGKEHLSNASYLGTFSSRCLATLHSCYLHCYVCSAAKFNPCLDIIFCVSQKVIQREPSGPQRAPLSQTLIGERFHQVLRRNSLATALWQRF